MPSGCRKEVALGFLYCLQHIEHLGSLYLKAVRLANHCKVILCLSRERAQTSGELALFALHSKGNSAPLKKESLCAHAVKLCLHRIIES